MRRSWSGWRLFVMVLTGLAVVAAGCGGDDDDGAAAPTRAAVTPAPAATATVPVAATQPAGGAGGAASGSATAMSIVEFSYAPPTLSVRAGQKVELRVRNNGQFPHSFTIDGVVDTRPLSAGASAPAEFTPAQAGTLTYYCTVHGRATMSGTLTVTAGGAAPSSAPPFSGGASPLPTPAPAGAAADYVY